jgi:hypothetical protein
MGIAMDGHFNSLLALETEFPVAMPVRRLKKSVAFNDNLECHKVHRENRERHPFKKG